MIKDVETCLRVLQDGGTILYPTDTIWGIGCDATNPAAVSKIFDIKKRNEAKSLIILVPDEYYIEKYSDDETKSIFEYVTQAEKPVTVIYKTAKNLAHNVINIDGSVGIRIVKDDFCKKLIESFGKPIVSTSANISGQPSPQLFNEIDSEIKKSVDYIVEHRQHETSPGIASTIISMNSDGSIHVLRK